MEREREENATLSTSASKKYKTDPDFIPIYISLEGFSRGSNVNLKRYEHLIQAFTKKFGHAPRMIARAPGRVNLIGEHVDYCGYSVLPMAIEQDIAMAMTTVDSQTLTLVNMNEHYPEHQQPAADYEIKGHAWHNYFLCGYRGILEKFDVAQPKGMQIMVDGNIPPSSGLSSSSALVCCAALVTMYGNDTPLQSKTDIANLCAASERFIGTHGGGMDQAISFLAQPGKALKIDFNPLQSSKVELPSGYAFVIANSLVSANKASLSGYNERVVECQLAAKLIAKTRGIDWRSTFKLAEVQKLLNLDLEEMEDVVKQVLHEDTYTHSEICKLLEIAEGQLVKEVLPHMNVQAKEAADKVVCFKLHQRAAHVYSEANRVIKFKETTEDRGESSKVIGTKLGLLMDSSHSSCSGLYECSCAKLDELVSLCRQGGACGSRLTGAGWGGCSVSIVSEDKLSEFLDFVAEKFYKKSVNELSDCLFSTKPGAGAAVCHNF